MNKKLFASAATVAVAFSTLAPLVPADAAPRQPLSHSQCTRLRGVQPWVPGAVTHFIIWDSQNSKRGTN